MRVNGASMGCMVPKNDSINLQNTDASVSQTNGFRIRVPCAIYLVARPDDLCFVDWISVMIVSAPEMGVLCASSS